MTVKRILAALFFVDFAALNAYALYSVGIEGLTTFLETMGPWGYVLAADVCIALGMLVVWMWADAKKFGRNPVPYTLLTLLGSFGPLAYVALEPSEERSNALGKAYAS